MYSLSKPKNYNLGQKNQDCTDLEKNDKGFIE